MCTLWQVWVVTSCWRGCRAPAGWLPRSAGRVVAGAGCAEEAGQRRDCLLQQGVEAGLLVGGAAGAELGDGAAVLVLGGELARPGRDGWGHVRQRAAGRGAVSRG